MFRRSLALLLLGVHVAAAAHLALAAHVTGESGAVVDAQPSCSEPGHGSAGIAHGHQLPCEERECQAVALTRAAVRVQSIALPSPVRIEVAAEIIKSAEASVPVGVLSVAPKSSPPV